MTSFRQRLTKCHLLIFIYASIAVMFLSFLIFLSFFFKLTSNKAPVNRSIFQNYSLFFSLIRIHSCSRPKAGSIFYVFRVIGKSLERWMSAVEVRPSSALTYEGLVAMWAKAEERENHFVLCFGGNVTSRRTEREERKTGWNSATLDASKREDNFCNASLFYRA